MKIILAILAIIATLTALSGNANSQQNCAPTITVADYLKQRGETPMAYGIIAEGKTLMQIYANKSNGAWTLVISNVELEISCLIEQGTSITLIPEAPEYY